MIVKAEKCMRKAMVEFAKHRGLAVSQVVIIFK